jgi:uncharacterized membrane protein YeaQ/YmgE (transglycosylase-associated protein family)
MFIVYMILIGLIAGGLAKLLMRSSPLFGLLVLGVGGSLIAGAIWFAESLAMTLIPSVVGAAVLLIIYGFAGERRVAEERVEEEHSEDDDLRKAA